MLSLILYLITRYLLFYTLMITNFKNLKYIKKIFKVLI